MKCWIQATDALKRTWSRMVVGVSGPRFFGGRSLADSICVAGGDGDELVPAGIFSCPWFGYISVSFISCACLATTTTTMRLE